MASKIFSRIIIVLTVIVSTLLVGLFLATRLNYSITDWLSLISYGAIFLFAGGLVLLICLLLLKRWWWVLALVVALLINISGFLGILQFPKCQSNPNGNSVKVMSYNVHSFKKRGMASTRNVISDFLTQNNIGIVCFQEYLEGYEFQADSVLKIFNKLPYSAKEFSTITQAHSYGLAIYSKYPVISSGKIYFNTTESNSAMWALIKIGADTVKVINAHLETTGVGQANNEFKTQQALRNTEEKHRFFIRTIDTIVRNTRIRNRQAKIISQFIEDSPYEVIVCGDFNDTPFSKTYTLITNNLGDSFKKAGSGYTYTYKWLHKLMRIDYILHSKQFTTLSYSSPSLEWSDHNPVIAEIELHK